MIQFNLLPSVKQEYVSARRNRRVTLMIAILVSGAALAIVIILFMGVQVVQKKYSADLSADIKSQAAKLTSTPDIDKVLTIQNQLASLPALHDQKPATTRLLSYLKQITPAKVSISSINVDFVTQSIQITGAADSLSTINTFVDTLKFTTYETADGQTGNAFSEVVLTSFSAAQDSVSYSIGFKYDPIIFTNTSTVTLTVPPGKITTRSETEKPLFQSAVNQTGAPQ